jgi:heme-degrading monooxygenase HmoA
MYLRLTRSRFDPAIYDQVAPLAREVHAAIDRLPGLLHHHLGVDRTAGTSATVTVWDTEAHARYAREALGEAIGRLEVLGLEFDPSEIFEMVDRNGEHV